MGFVPYKQSEPWKMPDYSSWKFLPNIKPSSLTSQRQIIALLPEAASDKKEQAEDEVSDSTDSVLVNSTADDIAS